MPCVDPDSGAPSQTYGRDCLSKYLRGLESGIDTLDFSCMAAWGLGVEVNTVPN